MGLETLKYDKLHRAEWLCHTYLLPQRLEPAHDFKKMGK